MTTTETVPFWLDLHRRAAETVQAVYRQIQRTDLDRMTPCVGWDLHQLLRHMTGQDHGFAAAAQADVGVDAFGPREVGEDVASALSTTLTRAHQAFAQADPQRPVLLPEFQLRRFPLAAVIGFHFVDTVVHGWDVAATIGVPLQYEPDLVAAAWTQARAVPDGPLRDGPGAAFAPPVSGPSATDGSAGGSEGGSDQWRETLRWLGRDPEWRAGRRATDPAST
jgi:uncharacterized protein (TIGR03086 family)